MQTAVLPPETVWSAGGEQNTLAAAYRQGGADYLRRQLSAWLGVPIDGALVQNRRQLSAVMDTCGPLPFTLTAALSGETSGHRVSFPPGEYQLDGAALADLGEDDMEIGMGQHGEGGGGRQPLKSADETAEIMVNALVKDIGIQPGEKVMLIINGSGATTLMEQLIIYRKCEQVLKEQNIEIVANYVGELLTVQEQAGFQMFMARMDDELLRLWNAPCKTPYLTK